MELPILADTHPHLRAEWDEEKNGEMKNYNTKSKKKVWWICSKGKCSLNGTPHRWMADIYGRTTTDPPRGCPYCHNKPCPCGCNSVWATNPELRESWDEKKNGDMKRFKQLSHKKVWWICNKGVCKTTNLPHTWEGVIRERAIKKLRCPYCYHRSCPCGCNSLWEKYPELRCEWDEEKNGDMKKFRPFSNLKVWWICKYNNSHKWYTKISIRTTEDRCGCPICRLSKMELTTQQALEQLEVKYIKQYSKRIQDRPLRYDFYIPEYNLFIECQGYQHFHSDFGYFRGNKTIEDLQERDNSKVQYVKDIKASFLSIGYTVLLKDHLEIIKTVFEQIKKEPLFVFYYDKNRFWSLYQGVKIIPTFENENEYIKEIVDVYNTQFELLN